MKNFYGSLALLTAGLISAVVHADPVQSTPVLRTAVLTEADKNCAKPDVGIAPIRFEGGTRFLVTDQGLLLLSAPAAPSIPALELTNTGN
jgi:hypothetical protein